MAELFFAVGTIGLSKLKTNRSTILTAARHNMRAGQKERGARAHIDPARSHENEHLHGPDTPEEVAALALSLMAARGVKVDKLRTNYAQAVELLFSLPADTTIDTGRFFADCVEWARDAFGVDNILSADVHRDEPAPHCHVLLLPMEGGRWVGSALIGKKRLRTLTGRFFREVASRHGLRQAERMDGPTRVALAKAVLERMNAVADPAMGSPAWEAIRRAVEGDPRPFAQALGVEVAKPVRKLRTMAAIFTSTGRKTSEDNPIGFEGVKPIGFEAKKDQTLSCVGFAEQSPPKDRLSVAREAQQRAMAKHTRKPEAGGVEVATDEGVTRSRDADFDVEAWRAA